MQPRFKIDLQRLLDPHDMTWSAPGLPSDWMSGAPIGNGNFGATIHGGPAGLTFTFGKTDVWQRYEHEGDTFATPFRNFRKICEEQNEREYNRLADESMKRFPGKDPHLTTCGMLVCFPHLGMNPHDLRMRVSLREATMRMTYDNAAIVAWMSHDHDVLVIEFDRGVLMKAAPFQSDFVPFSALPWEFMRPEPDAGHPNPDPAIERSGNTLLFTQALGRSDSYTVGMRPLGFGKTDHAVLSNRLCCRSCSPAEQKIYLLVTITSSADAADTRSASLARLDRAVSDGLESVREAHLRHWREYWMRGLATAAEPGIDRMYYRSLYLCGSIFRPGCRSPGLQGVWCGETSPTWNGDYHADVNIQSMYWGMFANNRLELLQPFLRFYSGFADHRRAVTRDVFGMRGLSLPFTASIDGREYTRGRYFGCAFDPACSAWLAGLFWKYFEYTLDTDWLKREGYPIIRDVARFLSDYLVFNKDTGRYDIYPSVDYEGGEVKSFGRNGHYATAWFRVGLQQAIRAAETLGIDPDERAEWRKRLENLAEPPVENGFFKPLENHPIDMTGATWVKWIALVFPAELVSKWHGPENWQRAALATWEQTKRLNNASRAWCGGLGIGDILRLGDVERAVSEARWPDRSEGESPNLIQENGFLREARGDFIQLDHTTGMCRVLADMLLMPAGNTIRLFTGIPPEMPARFYRLRAPGGFLISAEKRGCEVDYVMVQPTVDAPIALANPWKGRKVTLHTDSAEPLIFGAEQDVIATELKAGHTCTLLPEAQSIDDLPLVDFADISKDNQT